jgi:hypothetical protein
MYNHVLMNFTHISIPEKQKRSVNGAVFILIYNE